VTVILSLRLSAPSEALSRSTYVPTILKLAVVVAELGSLKTTAPGPLTSVQFSVIAPGEAGRPSSDALPTKVALFGNIIA
jgi:hypothetical protein